VTARSNRLPADSKHRFGGGAIDRGRPLSFRLNGRSFEAFAGDTVFSTLLAAGIDTAGTYHDEPIGLDERFAPPVIARGERSPAKVLPMDRTPIVAGLDLVTIGPRERPLVPRLRGLIAGGGRTLGHRLDDPHALEGGWLAAEPTETLDADTVVVGGGLAGMSAALAAADAGGRVILVERRGMLGGDARFFGTVGDQEAPETTIARLGEMIGGTPAITVLTFADAFAMSGNRVRVHQVAVENDLLAPRVLALEAKRIVLATGAAERLPVFPGNRAPGITGAVAAFNLAERYGVWPGKRAVVATPNNFAYRLALLAADAGIEVQRVADSRPTPQSRFIDFCKASGITLATGLVPRAAEPGRDAESLRVSFAVSIEGAHGDTAPMTTAQLVAAGTFQPRLALWLMAGGRCDYDAAERRIEARGTVDGVALAGAAAGYKGSPACLKSGESAIAQLLDRSAPPIEDAEVDAVYESREGAMPIAPPRPARGAAFLDAGFSFSTRPPRRDAATVPPAQLRALGISDVAAAVEIGLVPASDAGIIAAERCLGGGEIIDTGWRVTPQPRPSGPPAYLAGRFGAKPQLVIIAPQDARRFEPGCLIYPSSDAADPFAAVGAVIAPAPGSEGARALIAHASLGSALFVRDAGGVTPVRVVEAPET
jgi:sarcosine oxidase, subunit alpha